MGTLRREGEGSTLVESEGNVRVAVAPNKVEQHAYDTRVVDRAASVRAIEVTPEGGMLRGSHSVCVYLEQRPRALMTHLARPD